MKRVLLYNQYITESIRDKMTPKSEEDIKSELMKLSPDKKVSVGFDNDLPWLIELGVKEGGDFPIGIDGGTLIFTQACFKGNLSLVETFLEEDIDVDIEVGLKNACVAGHTEIVNLLLDKGADPNFYYGRPLKAAAENGNLECVKILLVHGAEMEWTTSYIEKLRPNVRDYLLKYKRSGFFRKIKDKIKHTFTNESLRDKMTPKSSEDIETALDPLMRDVARELTFMSASRDICGMEDFEEAYSFVVSKISTIKDLILDHDYSEPEEIALFLAATYLNPNS